MSEQIQPPTNESLYKRENLAALVSGEKVEVLPEVRQTTNHTDFPEWALPEIITPQSGQEHKESDSSIMGFSLNSDNVTNSPYAKNLRM